ncbi:cytochrome P450 [Scleroderma yunnanense]
MQRSLVHISGEESIYFSTSSPYKVSFSLTMVLGSIPGTAQLLAAILALGYAIISIMSKKGSSYPPQVPGLLPWVGPFIDFTFRRSEFIILCEKKYGPVFRLLLGGRGITIVGSSEAVHNVLFSDFRALTNRAQNYEHLSVLGSDSSLLPKLHEIAVREIFPILDRHLSKRNLGKVTPGFAEIVFNTLKRFTGNDQVSLKRSVTQPLYVATNMIVLGSRFSSDTYNDYITFLNSLPNRLSRSPFWSFPSSRALERLRQHISKHLEAADISNSDDTLTASTLKVFKAPGFPRSGGVTLFLALMLALHINIFNISFWLITWLLANPVALAAVRDEIDRAVREDFGSIQTFLAEATPENLESPSFALLHSAILETLRLATMLTGMRLAECDCELKDGERTVQISKGEYVVIFSRAVHHDEASYPGGHKFMADRFMEYKGQGNMVHVPSKTYFPFGAGKHLCKGRFLIIYQLKVLVTIYLSLFDVTPVPQKGSSEWVPPQPSAKSLNVIHPNEDVFVKLRPRFGL